MDLKSNNLNKKSSEIMPASQVIIAKNAESRSMPGTSSSDSDKKLWAVERYIEPKKMMKRSFLEMYKSDPKPAVEQLFRQKVIQETNLHSAYLRRRMREVPEAENIKYNVEKVRRVCPQKTFTELWREDSPKDYAVERLINNQKSLQSRYKQKMNRISESLSVLYMRKRVIYFRERIINIYNTLPKGVIGDHVLKAIEASSGSVFPLSPPLSPPSPTEQPSTDKSAGPSTSHHTALRCSSSESPELVIDLNPKRSISSPSSTAADSDTQVAPNTIKEQVVLPLAPKSRAKAFAQIEERAKIEEKIKSMKFSNEADETTKRFKPAILRKPVPTKAQNVSYFNYKAESSMQQQPPPVASTSYAPPLFNSAMAIEGPSGGSYNSNDAFSSLMLLANTATAMAMSTPQNAFYANFFSSMAAIQNNTYPAITTPTAVPAPYKMSGNGFEKTPTTAMGYYRE